LATYWKSRDIVPFRFFSKIRFDKTLIKPAIVFSLVGFIAFFVSRIDLLMISFLGAAKHVGVYGVAYKIAQQGEMLRNVCAVAFFPMLVKRFHGGTVRARTLFRYSLCFFAGIFVLSIVASLFAESAIGVLFGPQYRESGRVLRVLIFYLAFSWATLPLTSTLQATHNERHLIIPTLMMGGLNIGLNYLLFMRYGIIGIAYSTLAVESVGCMVYCVVAFTILKRQRYLV
jgi:O-antigen/teichoic acid export membrane protein